MSLYSYAGQWGEVSVYLSLCAVQGLHVSKGLADATLGSLLTLLLPLGSPTHP